jgi:hypothetical protein
MCTLRMSLKNLCKQMLLILDHFNGLVSLDIIGLMMIVMLDVYKPISPMDMNI